jgi:hypothetical protein
MRSKIIIIFIIIIYCLNNIYAKDEDAGLRNDGIKPTFGFYFKQKMTSEFEQERWDYLYLYNELNFQTNLPIDFYTLSIRVNDIFLTDFTPLINNYSDINAFDIIYNSLSAEIGNKFKIRKIITFKINLNAEFNAPVYDNLSLCINPKLIMEGDYYFGFFWNIEQSFPLDFYFVDNSMNLTISNYAEIGYEFFRFYGPKNFNIGILANNYFNVYIPYPVNINTFDDAFNLGIYFNFFGCRPSVFFVLENYGDFTQISNQFIGFQAGFLFNKKFFILSVNYKGLYDIKLNDGIWINKIDFYIKFYLN